MSPVRTVLVTGGNGFLGRSVGRGLVDAGHRVVSTDLALPVTPTPGVEHLIADVTRPADLAAAFAGRGIEVVVHLASIVTPGPGTSRSTQYAVDVEGTRNVLDACAAHHVRRVVVSSSGAAYGYHADAPALLREDDPLRGNEAFAYSHHKRLVEEMLAAERVRHPDLEQVVLRIGTILGERVDNQITALFDRARLLKIRGAASPFVFVWDDDVVAVICRAVTSETTGPVNVAGDGALDIDEIARRLGKPVLTVPEPVLRAVLAVASRLGVTHYGPEQSVFLRYRPVLANDRLKDVFGYVPSKTSAEAFEAWLESRRGRARDDVN